MASGDIWRALEVRDFRWLWIGSLASSFAMNMQIIARGWLVYTLTSSPLALTWVTLSFMLPMVLLSLFGGVVADRLPKRRIIVVAQLINCAVTLVMAFIVLTGRVTFWDFIWFGALNGSVLALGMPARQAFVPELIPERLIFTGMALNTTGWNLSRILGPALAGYLIAWLANGDTRSTYAVGVVYLVIAGLYGLSSLLTLLVSRRGEPARRAGSTALGDMSAGLRYVWRNPPVFGLIWLSVLPFLFGMPLNTFLPAFNEDVLAGGSDDLGLLLSAMGIGALLGSLLLATMGGLRHKARWLLLSCVGWGLATSAFALSRLQWQAVLLVGLFGFVSAWSMSLNRGLLQLQTSAEMRGRILAIDIMSHGLMPLGMVPIGFVAEQYGVGPALALSGLVLALLTGLSALTMGSVRRVDQGIGRV